MVCLIMVGLVRCRAFELSMVLNAAHMASSTLTRSAAGAAGYLSERTHVTEGRWRRLPAHLCACRRYEYKAATDPEGLLQDGQRQGFRVQGAKLPRFAGRLDILLEQKIQACLARPPLPPLA